MHLFKAVWLYLMRLISRLKIRKLLGGLIVYGMLQDQLMAFFRDPDDEDEQKSI